jgi:hypothetical protein
MPRLFQIFPIILISIFLAVIAWAQQGSPHIKQKPEEIKEINRGDFSKEKPFMELKERPISEEKLKTPQEIMNTQQDQAEVDSKRSNKKRVSKVGGKNKKNAEGFTKRADSPSHSSLAIGPRFGEPNRNSGIADFVGDYYKSKPKIVDDYYKSKPKITEDKSLIKQSPTTEPSRKPSKHN